MEGKNEGKVRKMSWHGKSRGEWKEKDSLSGLAVRMKHSPLCVPLREAATGSTSITPFPNPAASWRHKGDGEKHNINVCGAAPREWKLNIETG